MRLFYADPPTVRAPAPRVVPEPPSRGEPGGGPCRICTGQVRPGVWSDQLCTLHPPGDCSLPRTVWLASRAHVDSFADLPPDAPADCGRIAARAERAVLSCRGIARVHLYRWADGGAHFHAWFQPRPLGTPDAEGMMLPLREDVAPKPPDAQLVAAARQVATRPDTDELAPR